jgi:hypothetical protein
MTNIIARIRQYFLDLRECYALTGIERKFDMGDTTMSKFVVNGYISKEKVAVLLKCAFELGFRAVENQVSYELGEQSVVVHAFNEQGQRYQTAFAYWQLYGEYYNVST